ncbi:ligand-binding sensor domain-containing protein [Pontibacter fetidus]|uniref:histidine kinase n=1 Tax=Pontibacter fetidus TaxID=2700082 RepID=A0A6B2H9D1_9BACT|nr:two-component regulator propeller domain-containing protein [Pontibacter fetidus]NDK56122.1 hypothetical protein [Pontibacter fetidus]
MRLICFLCFWVVTGNAVLAQQYNFRNWTIADGLPQSNVVDIIQDQRMQLWVATLGGVSRFDGNTFHTYNKQQGLASNTTTCLFQDSRNRIWIGSADKGLTRFNGVSFTVLNTNHGLPAAAITSITEDKLGKLWVATDSGIYVWSGKKFNRSPHFPAQPYQVILPGAGGAMWAGSKNKGLYRLQQDKLQHFTSESYSLPSNNVTVIYAEPGTDNVWVGTTEGPAVVTDDKVTTLPLPPSVTDAAVSDFVKDGYGKMLIGLQQSGILKIDGDEIKHLTKANGLTSLHITSLYVDKENNIWIGNEGYGLQQCKAQWFLHFFELGDIKDPKITALAQDTKGRLWFGTDNGDAAYMQNGNLTMLEAKVWPPGTNLYGMWVKSEKDVWVSTSQGIWNLVPGKANHYTTAQGLPSDEVYTIITDTQGRLWAATSTGVAYLQGNTFHAVPVAGNYSFTKAYHLFRDGQNRIWVGTDNGIYRVKNNRLEKVKLLKQPFAGVMSVAADNNGWLYFGGYNYGLLAYHEKTGKAKLFTSANGLPNEGIKTLYTDRSNNLWVGTNNNVLKIDLPYFHQTQKLRFRSYGGENGFSGFEVSNNGITQTPDGKVWFGTTRGLTQYNPEMDRINTASPELMLTDISLFMRPTNWKKQGFKTDPATGLPVNLRLPFRKNHITFDFQGISMAAPAGVKYKYKLTGHDQQWSETTDQSFATYANLEPGTYTFKLKAQNSDGYWTQKPLAYKFSVIPPVWRREWFIGILLLLATGIVISVVRLREKSLVKMNALLEMRVNHRTRMLERKHREKELLLQEVHHRVKNNLQIVISLLNLQARHIQDPATKEVMQAIRSRVRSMALLHERLYRHNNLEHINLEEYFREICESLYAAYGVSEENVTLYLKIPDVTIDLDSAITLGLIVNELISNSLKYAFQDAATGKLGIELHQLENDHYQLMVWDNGIGAAEGLNQQKSFGLQLVASLTKKLGGEIKYENNNGTKFILYFVLPS